MAYHSREKNTSTAPLRSSIRDLYSLQYGIICFPAGWQVRALGSDAVDVEFALDLLELADRYLVDALKQLCEDVILKTIPVRS